MGRGGAVSPFDQRAELTSSNYYLLLYIIIFAS